MIPVGYMYKSVIRRPDWITAEIVDDICSVSGCVSTRFADYVPYWEHNGYWFFNAPAMMKKIAEDHDLDLSGATLFYYEVFEQQFDEDTRKWSTFQPEPSFHTDVKKPAQAQLQGFDVTSFSVGTSPECSPLSCCNLAAKIATNRRCLFDTFEMAKKSLEAGQFDGSEPGPFRIFAVYTVAS